jgi:lysophospholipase L1-like esterase
MLAASSLLLPAFSRAAATVDTTSDLLQGQIAVSKLADTSTDVPLGPRCTNMSVQVMRNILNVLIATPEVHCMFLTPAGFIDSSSTIIQPVGMSKAYPLQINHGGQPVILPIKGSTAALFLTNDTAYPGLNVGIYNDLFAQLAFSNNPFSMKYTLSGEPDTYLHYPNGKKLAANVIGSALSFSNDGRYMVVDGVSQGFMRVDLMTQQTVTFADDLIRVNDTGLLPGATAISASGQYAAVAFSAPGGWGSKYLKIIDVNTCTGSIASCKAVDIYSQLKAAVPTISAIDRVDFSSENSLLVTARYDFDGQKSKEGQFAITPAGQVTSREEYLAMGDSFASGEGAGRYLAGTDDSDNNLCHQSLRSYPYLLSSNLSSFASVACSGAVIDNIVDGTSYGDNFQLVHNRIPNSEEQAFGIETHLPGYNPQYKFLKSDNPRSVTISIGGNDMGFEDIIKKCTIPFNNFSSIKQNCYQSYEERKALLNQIDSQFNNLYQTYVTLKQDAPSRRVYVIGYPQIVNPNGSCAANVHLSKSDAQFAEQLTEYLDSVIAKAAAKAGVAYVDTQGAFDGHRLCDTGEKAVNGLTKGDDKLFMIANESYHPNAYGHELLADAISKATNNLMTPMPVAQNVANPIADDSLPILQVVANTHQQIYDIHNVNTSTQELLFTGSPYVVPTSSSPANLAPNSAFTAVLHSTPIQLGTIYTDTDGILKGSVQIPSSVPAGFHTIHYYGTNIAGEPVDIQDVVYVATSTNDYDGDGVPNASDSCPAVPQSGEDVDKDDIDDACDGDIGPALGGDNTANVNSRSLAAFTFVLTAAQNSLNSDKKFSVAAPMISAGTPQVLHAQHFAAIPKSNSGKISKTSAGVVIGAAAFSIILVASIGLFLYRLRNN